jgi:hypothetical protein
MFAAAGYRRFFHFGEPKKAVGRGEIEAKKEPFLSHLESTLP